MPQIAAKVHLTPHFQLPAVAGGRRRGRDRDRIFAALASRLRHVPTMPPLTLPPTLSTSVYPRPVADPLRVSRR